MLSQITEFCTEKIGQELQQGKKALTIGHKKTASYLHRTATTVYPCCVPTLGDSTGAGRVGLADCKYTTF